MPLVFAGSTFGQSYPARAIRLICPFPPAGAVDIACRALSAELSRQLAVNIAVENRPGAGGNVGLVEAVKSAPDGYTLGFAHTGTTAINPHLMARSPYDPLTELLPLTPIVSYANVLIVNSRIPATTVQEFVQWAKSHPNEAYFASGGLGATNHLSGELLKALTGMPLKHVPYRGNGPAMNDVIAGTVACMFDIPVTVVPQLKGGRVRALAILSSRRSSVLPDVPTLREAGFPGVEDAGSDLWFGLVAPPALPPAVAERLHAQAVKVVQSPEMSAAIREMGYEPWTMTPAEFKTFIRNDHAKWGKVIKAAGLQPQ